MLSLLWEFILVIFRKCFPMFPLWFHNLSNTHYFFSYLQGLGGNEVSVLCSSFLCIWKFWSCLLKSGVFLVCSFGNKTFSQYFLVLYFFFLLLIVLVPLIWSLPTTFFPQLECPTLDDMFVFRSNWYWIESKIT